jgi:hypothetical protein
MHTTPRYLLGCLLLSEWTYKTAFVRHHIAPQRLEVIALGAVGGERGDDDADVAVRVVSSAL